MKKTLRKILPVLALVLVVAVASVGGTLAWLKASTDPVTNTFTVGDINIDLYETVYPDGTKNEVDGKVTRLTPDAWKAKLIPGKTYEKDPVVVVKAGSEPCWLFVKVDGTASTLKEKGILEYTLNFSGDWKQGEGEGEGKNGIPTNVYYAQIDRSTNTADYTWHLLQLDKVRIPTTVTKAMIKDLTGSFTMTFKAYAIQQDGFDTAADAWKEAQKAD